MSSWAQVAAGRSRIFSRVLLALAIANWWLASAIERAAVEAQHRAQENVELSDRVGELEQQLDGALEHISATRTPSPAPREPEPAVEPEPAQDEPAG